MKLMSTEVAYLFNPSFLLTTVLEIRFACHICWPTAGKARASGIPTEILPGSKRPDVPGLPKINMYFSGSARTHNEIFSKIHTREWMFEDPAVKFELQEKSVDESVKRTAWKDVAWSSERPRMYRTVGTRCC